MPGETKQYSPAEVVCTFGPHRIRGFAKGTFIIAKFNADHYSTKVGADGDGTRVRMLDKSGTVEVTLLASSASNLALSALASADELTPNGAMQPLMIKDNLGNSITTASAAWVQKRPDQAYADDPADRTWVFATLNLNMVDGGA